MTPTLEFDGKVAVVNLGDSENRFSLDWIDTVNQLLDEAEAAKSHALVTTSSGKFYSNGLDLDWVLANADRTDWYVNQVQELFARVLTFPMPTVAAVGGHTFGAGAVLAIAHDYRAMRSDRGYYCFPEVDINIPFTPGMAALIQAKLPPRTAVLAMTTGHRFGGAEALSSELVDAIAPEGKTVEAALDLVAPLGEKNPATLGAIKSTMFATVVGALRQGRA